MLVLLLQIFGFFTKPLHFLMAFFATKKRISPPTNPILFTSATLLATRIRNKEISSTEIVSTFINRCKQINPIVNAIIEDRFEEALKDARKVDDFLSTTKMSGSELAREKPLLGVPVTIKECCSVKGMSFSMGLAKYRNCKASRNGDAVELLLNAGAIVIAITSTPPYSLWIETFNNIVGYTVNPHDSRRSSGGSSGGEAALISCAASILGLGSDAGGSIRIPSAFCGVFGHKSSNQLVSAKGHAAFFTNHELFDSLSVGPLCRYACDLELMMNVLSANKFQSGCSTVTTAEQINVFYLDTFDRATFSVNSIIKTKLSQVLRHFQQKGCHVEKLEIPEFRDILGISSTLAHRNAILWMADNKSDSPSIGYKFFGKLLRFLQTSKFRFLWHIDHELYMKKKFVLEKTLLTVLKDDGVFLLPTWPESAFYKFQSGCKLHYSFYDYFVNAFGLSATAVPIGIDENDMPLSLQVIAAPKRDKLCVIVVKEMETFFGGWIPPYKLE